MEHTNYKEVYKKVSDGKLKSVTPTSMEASMPKMRDKIYPSFHLPVKDIPESKDWKIGGKYKLELEVVQTAVHANDMMHDVTFEIRKIKPIK